MDLESLTIVIEELWRPEPLNIRAIVTPDGVVTGLAMLWVSNQGNRRWIRLQTVPEDGLYIRPEP